jgi:hypothetical protein
MRALEMKVFVGLTGRWEVFWGPDVARARA